MFSLLRSVPRVGSRAMKTPRLVPEPIISGRRPISWIGFEQPNPSAYRPPPKDGEEKKKTIPPGQPSSPQPAKLETPTNGRIRRHLATKKQSLPIEKLLEAFKNNPELLKGTIRLLKEQQQKTRTAPASASTSPPPSSSIAISRPTTTPITTSVTITLPEEAKTQTLTTGTAVQTTPAHPRYGIPDHLRHAVWLSGAGTWWKDQYLPNTKLCIPGHPATFGCDPRALHNNKNDDDNGDGDLERSVAERARWGAEGGLRVVPRSED